MLVLQDWLPGAPTLPSPLGPLGRGRTGGRLSTKRRCDLFVLRCGLNLTLLCYKHLLVVMLLITRGGMIIESSYSLLHHAYLIPQLLLLSKILHLNCFLLLLLL